MLNFGGVKSKVDEMDVVYGLLSFTQLQMQDSNSQIPQDKRFASRERQTAINEQ